MEGGREGGRERGREGGREGGRERGREGGRGVKEERIERTLLLPFFVMGLFSEQARNKERKHNYLKDKNTSADFTTKIGGFLTCVKGNV